MTEENQQKASPSEPTVLDWVKSLLRFRPIPIPEPDVIPELITVPPAQVEVEIALEESTAALEFPLHPAGPLFTARHLRLPIALFLALFAQFFLELKPQNVLIIVVIYLIAGVIAGWGAWKGDFNLSLPSSTDVEKSEGRVKLNYLSGGAIFSLLTFFTTRNNQFTFLNLVLWIGSLVCFVLAFWEGDPPYTGFLNWVKSKWETKRLDLQIRPWHLLVTGSILVILFFRLIQMERVPYEMWSDQAEKLWDVMDVLDGKYSIFFPANTGREPLQFYMAAAIVKFLNTRISFETLKISSILAGLLTLPYLYLFAKEFGGKYVGLAAVLLAGVGYWPNVISRLGLRFPLYPLFVAPALYYLLRAIRLQRRNDFILCGFAVGLGLHGYSPARVLPFAVTVGVLIYLFFQRSNNERKKILTWLILSGVIALAVFMPLLGAISNKDFFTIYLSRMITRVGQTEQTYPDSPMKLLIGNLWRGLLMFNWDDGEIWVVSIPFRPALDWVTGAFFALGVVIVFVRFLKKRRWEDLFLLLLIPILMLPSILSLSFPGENPAPNRASGAIIPVFTIAAIPLVLFPMWAKETFKNRIIQRTALVLSLALFILAASLNYKLVFQKFVDQHRQSTWNTSEIGAVIRGFAETVGSYETAHVIPYRHWVDTRLVGVNAGDPGKDYGVWADALDQIPPEPDRPQLFIFKPEDAEAFGRLSELYPQGILRREISAVEGRDFMLYYVFPDESIEFDLTTPGQ